MDPSRITLRPFKLTDADDLLSWAGDDQVTKSGRWRTLTSKEEALTFIEQVCIPHPWRRSICIDDRSIGFLSVFPAAGDEGHRADVGFAIAVEYWGQGITTAALRMGIPQVFDDVPQILRLQAFTSLENKTSQRVLEKAGFTREGLLRKYVSLKGRVLDVIVFSLLSSDSCLS